MAYVNTRAAAAILGCSTSFLEKRRSAYLPPNFVKLGTRVVYDTAALDAWVAQCTMRMTVYGNKKTVEGPV
jgi:hypothetical protein